MTTNKMTNFVERADQRAERWLEERVAAEAHPHVTPLSLLTIIALLALGVLGIISPAFWGGVAPLYIGTLLIIAGASFALMAIEWPGLLTRTMLLTVGGLGIAAGILMYYSPNIGLYVFSLILGLYFLFEGVMKIFCFPRYSTISYAVMFVSGLISAGLGIVIAWVSAIDIPWVPGFLFGIDLCIGAVAFFLVLMAANCEYLRWRANRREAIAQATQGQESGNANVNPTQGTQTINPNASYTSATSGNNVGGTSTTTSANRFGGR